MKRTALNEVNHSSTIVFSERPGVDFRVTKVVGRGASCVVYHAVCSDNTEHLLKEYYPKHLDIQRQDSGYITVSDTHKNAFEQGLVRFKSGCEQQKNIRLSNENLKNFTCNVQGYYKANGTEYIDMTCFNGQTYDSVQEKSAYDLMVRMKTLAQVVNNYHKAGLLHLDIKPENIYVRPETETIEDVMLFDFDSVTSMDTLTSSKALSCTKIWAAPEQLLMDKRSFICPATDLFAIGEIIFVQLFGRHSTSAERRSYVKKYSYDHSADIFRNMNPKVFPLLDDLLCHTICSVVEKRYQSADALISKLDEIIKIANPEAPYLKSSLPAVQDFFVGRENEIEEIHRKLSENRILFLNGIGGIGKSELAKHYALEHKNEYDTIIFAPYISDVNMLLQDDSAIPLYNFAPYPEEKPEEYCARKLHKLQELCDERTLFIVDNLDTDDDPNLHKLFNLSCRLLFTTRMDFSEYGMGQTLSLDALSDRANIRKIFDKHYTKPISDEDNAVVEQIIDLVAGHTMTVELLAKQMMAGRVKPQQMLDKLQTGGISESGKEKVRSSKDGILSAQNTYSHIQALFDLSELNEDEKYILANLSLIPYTGIDIELFHDWCELDGYDTINQLVVEGWVRLDKETDFISLHPVITQITRDLPHLEECCSTFLHHGSRATSWEKLSLTSDSWLIHVLRNTLQNVIMLNFHTEQAADYLRRISSEIQSFIDIELVKYSHQRALSIRLELFGEMHNDVAISYHYLANLYATIGDYAEAEKYCNEALEIKKQLYGVLSHSYTHSLRLLGTIYRGKKQYDIALDLFEKAKQYYENLGETYSSGILACYLQIGDTYSEVENYSKALEIKKWLLNYRIKTSGDKSLSTATAYYALSTTYRRCGELQQAIKNGEKALKIQLSIYGKYHTSIARSYSSLGMAYMEDNNQQKALEYLEKALGMRKTLLGNNHQLTAKSYYRLGLLYEKMCDYQLAIKHYQQALDIRVSLLGNDHTDTVEAKNKIATMNILIFRKADN